MNHEPDKSLEEFIHRELRQLPPLRAPADLIARVRAAIASQGALPWWAQSWFAWPGYARLGSALAAAALLAGLVWVSVGGWAVANPLGEAGGTLAALGGAFSALVQFLATAAGVTPPALLAAAVGGLAVMYLGCVGLGTLFYRVVVNPR
jgi:hypothetical protein